jgi:integrase/recombinase XerD
MKRQVNPQISSSGAYALAQYEQTLREWEDLTQTSIRNCLSDVRHFIAWFEACEADTQIGKGFDTQCITTPTLTRYRTSLQADGQQKPASVNRVLISLKCSIGRESGHQLNLDNPSTAVKPVGQGVSPPRHLDDQEEQALVATVTKAGIMRDRMLIVLLLYTGLRAREVCHLRCDQVKLDKRSGFLEIIGKRNTYREVQLNATACKVLEENLPTHPPDTVFLFPSGKTNDALSECALSYIVKKNAHLAKLPDVSPLDLRHHFGYRMAASVLLHRLAQIRGYDSLDTTKLCIQGTKHDLQQAVETIVWI